MREPLFWLGELLLRFGDALDALGRKIEGFFMPAVFDRRLQRRLLEEHARRRLEALRIVRSVTIPVATVFGYYLAISAADAGGPVVFYSLAAAFLLAGLWSVLG